MRNVYTLAELLESRGFVVVTFVAVTLISTALNSLVIAYGPQEIALSALIYGPFSKGAGATGFMFIAMGCLMLMRRKWIRMLPMMIVGSAFLVFSYDISLDMALASRSNEIPAMIVSDMGCFPARLTETLVKLEIPQPESVSLCSEI